MKRYVDFLLISLLFLQACQNSNLINEPTITPVLTYETIGLTPSLEAIILTSVPEEADVSITSSYAETEEVAFRVEGVLEKNMEQFKFIEIEKTDEQVWESIVNPTAEYRAFHLCKPPCGVFVEELFSGKIYELSAPDFNKNRNFKDLSWKSMYILEFKQVTSPNIAIGYTIDVVQRQLLDMTHYIIP